MKYEDLYKTKNDVIFRYLFSKEEYLKDLLEAILEVKISSVEIVNNYELTKDNLFDKIGRLDIKAVINDKKVIDFEMQNKKEKSYQKRILFYFGSLIKNQLNEGNEYDIIKDVIIINILNKAIFDNIDKYHTVWNFREEFHPEYKLEGVEIHFIELDKFRKSHPDLNNKLNQWLAFIDDEDKEMEEKAMEKNKEIRKASSDKKRFLTEDEKRWAMEDYLIWSYEFETGLKDAREEGRRESNISIAKKMLLENMNIKIISKITGLKIEEIKELKRQKV